MARLLHGNDRERERLTQSQTIGRIANRIRGSFESELKRAMEEAAQIYRRDGSDSSVVTVVVEHQRELENLIRRDWVAGVEAGGRRTIAASKSLHGPAYRKQSPIEDEFDVRVREILEGDALPRAAGLAATTVGAMRGRIQRGIRDGLSVDAIAKQMMNDAPMLSAYRAMMIARTESHAAYNAGHYAAAEVSDLELQREWISAGDERTRDDEFNHVAADGEIVEVRQPFVLTGEALQYPGDPRGSAGNIIHCRCGAADIVK